MEDRSKDLHGVGEPQWDTGWTPLAPKLIRGGRELVRSMLKDWGSTLGRGE